MVLRYHNIHAFDNNKTMKIIYSMYRAGEVSVHRACCEGLPNPTRLEGEVRFVQSQDQPVLPHVVREWKQSVYSLASMLIKMYKFTISGYVPVYVHCIDSQSISYRRSLSLFGFFCLTRQFYQKS